MTSSTNPILSDILETQDIPNQETLEKESLDALKPFIQSFSHRLKYLSQSIETINHSTPISNLKSQLQDYLVSLCTLETDLNWIHVMASSNAISTQSTKPTSSEQTNINTLAASAVVTDMSLLATSDVIADMALLADSDVIADMNTLAVTDIINDINSSFNI